MGAATTQVKNGTWAIDKPLSEAEKQPYTHELHPPLADGHPSLPQHQDESFPIHKNRLIMLRDRPSVRPVRPVPRLSACHCFHGRAMCRFFFFLYENREPIKGTGLLPVLETETAHLCVLVDHHNYGPRTETFLENLRAAWQRQTVNEDACISNGMRRAPKQALRLRFCEELCPGKQQNDGEMTETQSTRLELAAKRDATQQAPRHALHCDSRPRRPRWRNAQVPHLGAGARLRGGEKIRSYTGREHGRWKQSIFSLSIFGILVERLSFLASSLLLRIYYVLFLFSSCMQGLSSCSNFFNFNLQKKLCFVKADQVG